MPLVRIDVPMNMGQETRRKIADVVYDALVAVMHVPENDRFMVVQRHF